MNKQRMNAWKTGLAELGWRKLLLLALLTALAAYGLYTLLPLLTGSGAAVSKDAASDLAYTDSRTGLAGGEASEASSEAAVPADEVFDASKILYSGSIRLYTDDFDKTFEAIGGYAKAAGGFIQDAGSGYLDLSRPGEGMSGYLTIRIPAERFEEAMKNLEGYGQVVSTSRNSTNITRQYQDIEGQLGSLKIQEARLLDYLAKAGNITDLLAIEKELNRVRTEIDSRTTLLRNWDKEIAYSTITVNLTERELASTEVKSPFGDMGKKVQEGFISSINLILNLAAGLVVWIFRILPFAVLAAAGWGTFRLVRHLKKKKKE